MRTAGPNRKRPRSARITLPQYTFLHNCKLRLPSSIGSIPAFRRKYLCTQQTAAIMEKTHLRVISTLITLDLKQKLDFLETDKMHTINIVN